MKRKIKTFKFHIRNQPYPKQLPVDHIDISSLQESNSQHAAQLVAKHPSQCLSSNKIHSNKLLKSADRNHLNADKHLSIHSISLYEGI